MMIDSHIHILPNVDDGANDLAESREMLVALAAAGYTHVVATPHLMQPLRPDYEAQVLAAWEQTKPVAREAGIELLRGFEHMVASDIPVRLRQGERSTIGGGAAILVELPFLGWRYEADRVYHDLQADGYLPIMAHPERYVEAAARPDLVLAIAERGVVLQLTFASFAGVYGREVQKFARRLLMDALELGIRVLFATDAHGTDRRLASIAPAIDWVNRNVDHGPAVVEWATSVVPRALIDSQVPPSFDDWHDWEASGVTTGRPRFSWRSLKPLTRRTAEY